MLKLGVNIDHVATLRQARKTIEPSPMEAAIIAEKAKADGITVHLREDRRHINDKDVFLLRKKIKTRLNLEMSTAKQIVEIALKVKPDQATLVPEKRQEITTEGGLDVVKNFKKVKDVVKRLQRKNIKVSLFIEPEKKQIDAALKSAAEYIEIHTGAFACARTKIMVKKQLEKIKKAAIYAKKIGLKVNAGHGLNYENTGLLVREVPEIEELNIGHAIVSRAVLIGLDKAVRKMKDIIRSSSKKK